MTDNNSPKVLYSKTLDIQNKKVISFSVYGTQNVYLLGAEKNIDIAKTIYPDWICRFYCSPKIKNLEELKRRAELGECEVIVIDSPIFEMYWRYFALDDPSISRVIVRDTDSLLNYREQAAVLDWEKSNKVLHTMHDHTGGHWSPVMGGMCGFKLPLSINIHQSIDEWCRKKSKNYTFHYSQDQSFLSEKILPLYLDSQIDHHCDHLNSKWKNSIPFPDHEPIKYGNFVGDRISAFALIKNTEETLASKKLFLMPHLGPDDHSVIKNLIPSLLKHYEEIIIPYKKHSELAVNFLFGGHPNLKLHLVKQDDNAFDLYVNQYNTYKFIGLGCHSNADCGYAWGLKHAYKQSGLDFEDELYTPHPDKTKDYKTLNKNYLKLLPNFKNTPKTEQIDSPKDISIKENIDSLVSVVIPTFNRFKFLQNAIKSVYNQSHQNFEIIVVNDKSTESSYYDSGYENNYDHRLNIVNLPKNSRSIYNSQVCGGGDSRNIGMMMSSGRYISCLDDDDSFLPLKLEKQINAVKDYNVKISCTEALYGVGPINPDKSYDNWHYNGVFWSSLKSIFSGDKSKILETMYEKDYNIWTKDHINIHNTTCGGSSIFFDKSLIYKAGYFPIMGQGEDWQYWKKLIEHSDCVYIREPLTYIDARHGNGQQWK